MTEVKTRISGLLMAMLLLLCMLPQAYAAENGTAGLTLQANWQSGDMVVTVAVTGGEGVSNGRLHVSYDPALMRLTDAKAVLACGASSINTKTEGSVGFAWVGSSLSAAETSALVLTFAPIDGAEQFNWTAEADEVYASAEKLEVSGAMAGLSLTPDPGPTPNPNPTPNPKPNPTPDPDPTPGLDNPFTDITGHWGEDEILKAYHDGLFSGVSATKFAPDAQMTRGMLVTVLHRLAGEPEPRSTQTAFTDVPQSAYYAKAVAWAVESGVVNGISATEFAPESNITRQQLVTMLYRYAKFEGRDVSASADISRFSDAASVQDYALNAVRWAVAEGILKGNANNQLMPNGLATRAETAALMVRYTA